MYCEFDTRNTPYKKKVIALKCFRNDKFINITNIRL